MEPTDPTTLGLSDALDEDVNRRTLNSIQFQQRSDTGRKTSLLVSNLFYEIRAGEWEPQELDYRLEGANHVSDRGSYHSRVTDDGVELTDPGTGVGVRWNLPARAGVSSESASLTADGVVWSYRKGPKRLKLTGTVAAPLGLRTFQFPYTPLGAGATFTLQNGQAVMPGLVVPAPTVLGADGILYPSSGWQLATGRLELVFDDASLPPEAYPYVVDPTTTLDHSTGCDDTYIDSVNTTNNWGNEIYFRLGDGSNSLPVAMRSFVKWDASSIDAAQIVTGATASLYHGEGGSNVGGLTSWDIDIHVLLEDWHETQMTWVIYSTGNNWGTAGASNATDRRDAISATVSLAASPTNAYVDWTSSTVIDDVQAFVANSSTNYGWIFQALDAEDQSGYSYQGLDTTEHSTALRRPKLVVIHQNPNPVTAQAGVTFF